MTPQDPDQDLLNKLDRQERRSDAWSMAPAFGVALAAALVTFGILRFGIHWSTESALDVAGLTFILSACLAYLHTRSANRS